MTQRNERIYRIIAEIEKEMEDLDKLHAEFVAHKDGNITDSYYLRAVALTLHDFYSGVERVFVIIGKELNGSLPKGASWHRTLLRDMQLDIKSVRPSVISEKMVHELEDFLDFRHRIRNIYGYTLEWERMRGLVRKFPSILSMFQEEIGRFVDVMRGIANELEISGIE